MISFCIDDVFMAGKLYSSEKTKEKINLNFNIQESGKGKKFIGVYYGLGRYAKGSYVKMTMEKDVKKLVKGFNNHTGSNIKVQKTPGATGTAVSKSDLEEPQDIDNYRSFVVHLMWYTTNVGPDVANASREFSVNMSHTGTEHWNALGSLIGYLKGKETKIIVVRKPKVIKAVMFCDSNYATDKETINSVIGIFDTLGGKLLTCS